MDELQKALTIQCGVQPAIDSLNAHDHSGELGGGIPEDGLKDGAVSTGKIQYGAVITDRIADKAVTTDKIANGAITLSKLSPDLSLEGNGGVLGQTDYIADGLKLTPASELTIVLAEGSVSIANKAHRIISPQVVELQPNKVALIYAQKSLTEDKPVIGIKNAELPEVVPGETICRYIFNQKVNDNMIPDTSGNGMDIYVQGNCTLVDGWFDKSIRGDGTSGWMKTVTSGGLPVGAGEREVTILFTITNKDLQQCLFQYGQNDNNGFAIWVYNGRFYIGGGCNTDTGFPVVEGKTYLITLWYNGYEYRLFVNGVQVWRLVLSINTIANTSNLQLFKYISGNYFATVTIHYFELRNRARTPVELARMSNKFIIPIRYDASAAEYPANPSESTTHVWKFDETSGPSVADELGTLPLNMVGTGPILDSDLGLGKSRRIGSSYGYLKSSANFTLNDEFTIITVFKLNSLTGSPAIFANHAGGSTGGGIFALSYNGNGKISCWSPTQSWQTLSDKITPLQHPNFVVWSYKAGRLTTYLNSLVPENIVNYTVDKNANPLFLGGYANGSNVADGIYEYVAYIPRQLAQAELAQYYYAFTKQGKRNIVKDILPPESISLGYARTDSLRVIEVNDDIYLYGRKEGTDRTARKFAGWTRVWVGMGDLTFENPFQTSDARVASYVFKNNVSDEQFTPMETMYRTVYSASAGTNTSYMYGIDIKEISTFRIRICHNLSSGAAIWHNYAGDSPSSGYIGIWLEVDQ